MKKENEDLRAGSLGGGGDSNPRVKPNESKGSDAAVTTSSIPMEVEDRVQDRVQDQDQDQDRVQDRVQDQVQYQEVEKMRTALGKAKSIIQKLQATLSTGEPNPNPNP